MFDTPLKTPTPEQVKAADQVDLMLALMELKTRKVSMFSPVAQMLIRQWVHNRREKNNHGKLPHD